MVTPAARAAAPRSATLSRRIHRRADHRVAIQRGQPLGLAHAHHLIGDQHVLHAAGDQAFGLGKLRARDADRRAGGELGAGEGDALVGFEMGAELAGAGAEVIGQEAEVAVQRLRVHEQGRGGEEVERLAEEGVGFMVSSWFGGGGRTLPASPAGHWGTARPDGTVEPVHGDGTAGGGVDWLRRGLVVGGRHANAKTRATAVSIRTDYAGGADGAGED